ncbi:response regulator [uncultured Ramlibacter sp.]|uniref:response regulator n=1 Tax=uncultured Ramlibacter sp. TaxID=260755 RepID=UPI00263778D9|nr:response regulator [uncultured Ramlibacter sp.]
MSNKTDVLVVDDDPDYCELASEALKACGQQTVLCLYDGTEALDWLHAKGPYAGRDTTAQPRLVLLDLKLVALDGLEVLRQMRAAQPTRNVPVVVVSGTDDQAVLRSCYEAGANSIVRKTADPAEFERKMRGIFEFWLNVNEQNRESRV